MSRILFLTLFSVAVVSCGGGGGGGSESPPPTVTNPTTGTGYTAKGTLLSTKCEGTTVVREYADGNGGSTFTRTDNWSACGYSDESLDVSVGPAGDYFQPVVVEVDYMVMGKRSDFEYSVPHGRVEETDTGILIYSDGVSGFHVMTINGEEYQYELIDPPVCEGSREGFTVVDCLGLRQSYQTPWYIFYGDEDTTVVEWELVYVGRMKTDKYVDEPDAFLQKRAEDAVAGVQAMYDAAGVHVRLKLVQVVGTYEANSAFNPTPYIESGEIAKSDIVVVDGALPQGLCGQAGKVSSFRDRSGPLRAVIACGYESMAHEIGHSVGLGHGPNNGVAPEDGATFPEFARGGDICGYRAGIMQYGGAPVFSNHKKKCSDYFGDDQFSDQSAGSLSSTSTAYAMNRVRYDVSLVNNEHASQPPPPKVAMTCDKRIDNEGVTRDCYGYRYNPVGQPTTWYGPDDKSIAQIELGLARSGGTIGLPISHDHEDAVKFREWIGTMNTVNVNSGVYIEFTAGPMFWAGSFYGVREVPVYLFKGEADIVVGWGPGPTQGEAFVSRSFSEGMRPPALQSYGSATAVLHELGHVMGLGHGVWGNPDWVYGDDFEYESGGFFLEFGHGWSGREGICQSVDSVMSYGNKSLGWSNSLLECPMGQDGRFGRVRGSRSHTDEAYSLNRVRWHVSRISP